MIGIGGIVKTMWTLEQAIEIIETHSDDISSSSLLGQALNMAIDALKAQLSQEGTTKDAISRQATIDAVNNAFDRETLLTGFVRLIAVRVIRDMPSAQPEPPWILCSKKMPDEHEWLGTKKFGTTISDEVYVTFENEKGERFCQHMKFQNGELSRYDQLHIDTWYKGSKPIAWMPLPKPFEGGIK